MLLSRPVPAVPGRAPARARRASRPGPTAAAGRRTASPGTCSVTARPTGPASRSCASLPSKALTATTNGMSGPFEVVDRGVTVVQPGAVDDDQRAQRAAGQVVPHEAEPRLSGRSEQVELELPSMVTQPKSIATVVVFLSARRAGRRYRPGRGHLRLGGQRRDLGDRADRGGLADSEPAGDDDLDRDRRPAARRRLARSSPTAGPPGRRAPDSAGARRSVPAYVSACRPRPGWRGTEEAASARGAAARAVVRR